MPLTLDNAGALVSGVKPKEDVVEMKTVRVLRSFFNHEGKVVEKDSIVILPKYFADQVVASNKAKIVADVKPIAEKMPEIVTPKPSEVSEVDSRNESKEESKQEEKQKEDMKASKKNRSSIIS